MKGFTFITALAGLSAIVMAAPIAMQDKREAQPHDEIMAKYTRANLAGSLDKREEVTADAVPSSEEAVPSREDAVPSYVPMHLGGKVKRGEETEDAVPSRQEAVPSYVPMHLGGKI